MDAFRVILRKDDELERMRFVFPDYDEAHRLDACQRLAEMTTCEPRGLMADGSHAEYFRDIFFGTTLWRLYEIRMFSDMVPRLVFKESKDQDDRFAMIATLIPERIEMVMTRHNMTEIIIKD